MNRIITAVIVSLVIAGCAGGLRGKSNLVQPTELNSTIPSNLVVKGWEVKTGSQTPKESNLRFLIADDGVGTLYVAGQKGIVTAIDMSSGSKVWEHKVGSQLYTGVGYSQGVLLVGRQDAYVEALSANGGESMWSKKVLGVPAVPPVGNGNLAIVRTLFGAVETFDLQTGEDRWAYIFNNSELSVRGAAPPTFMGADVLVASDEGTLALIDAKTGAQKWSTVLSEPLNGSFMGGLRDVDAAMIVTDDRIFVGQYLSGITALNHHGRKLWQKGKGTYAGLVFTGDAVVSVERDSTIQALNAQDGSPVWDNRDLRGRNLTKPVLVGNRIVVGDYQGYVHVLDASTGALQGSTKIGSNGFLLDIKEINGNIYLLDYSGTLYKVSI
ncbi:PQQ-binding-like beta-propeller repeat protein [Ignatzschineria rhizosphaerae]|uniref:Outer membrane protein assembly factor BamB n=1 Tax=Ignatzschineria rhizosphaerae TaxID=2923279 RepID=A0ABY3WXA2_9GAMM|nr:PQQ-binding-like beta-propeller repeat protein [Ignatzschineria rhizosphaerae]UNM95232.1 PQQ-binding-like beta-propeller repeat protein [Ignatzschineria rhizosphaerae]